MSRASGLELKIPPALVTVVVGAFVYALDLILPQFAFPFPQKSIVAAGIAIVGVSFGVSGIAVFRRSKTTVNPIHPERASSLVVGGIYSISRNPMYTGILLLIFAWAVYLANLIGLFLGPVLFIGYMTRYQIIPEEEALFRLFGDDFGSYRNSVRRWL